MSDKDSQDLVYARSADASLNGIDAKPASIKLVFATERKFGFCKRTIFVCGDWPKTKELLELFLFLFLVQFLIKRNLREKKNLLSQDPNLEPPDPQSGTLPTELRRH